MKENKKTTVTIMGAGGKIGHRITVEQLALLEPAMAEVIVATGAMVFKEALDEVVKLGVPKEAARSFMLGHIQAPLAICFGTMVDATFSDACKIAMKTGYDRLIKPDWKEVLKPEVLKEIDSPFGPRDG